MDYNINKFVTKRGVTMNYFNMINEIAKKRKGIILTSDLSKENIPREYLSRLEKLEKIERVSRGVYVTTDAIDDEMYFMQLKVPKIIYSHDTALFMHGLSDRTPNIYSITIPSNYRVSKEIKDTYKVFYIKPELYEMGKIIKNTSFGNEVMVYDIERTICDIVRSRSKIDIQIFNDALKRYVKLKTADLNKLHIYAKELKIYKLIRLYMEVLL